MREAKATVAGWIDPVTGQPTRRSDTALKLWRYYNPKFLSQPVYFATPGVTLVDDALEIGYNMVVTRIARITDE